MTVWVFPLPFAAVLHHVCHVIIIVQDDVMKWQHVWSYCINANISAELYETDLQ